MTLQIAARLLVLLLLLVNQAERCLTLCHKLDTTGFFSRLRPCRRPPVSPSKDFLSRSSLAQTDKAHFSASDTFSAGSKLHYKRELLAVRVWRGGNSVGVREHSRSVNQCIIRPVHQTYTNPPRLCFLSLYLEYRVHFIRGGTLSF